MALNGKHVHRILCPSFSGNGLPERIHRFGGRPAMTNAAAALRALLVYSICIPLALFLGYVLASPLDRGTFISVGLVFGLLVLPLVLKHHHPALVLMWNTTAVVFFLPGRPNIWMLLAVASFTITVLQYILARRSVQPSVRTVTRPVIAFGVVVVVTMLLTGGVGFMAFGSEVGGGKRYALILAGILGYFAISMQRISLEKATRYIGLYFLGGITVAIGSLGPYLPSGFSFLFLLFPPDSYYSSGEGPTLGTARLFGVSQGAMFALYFMLARYGIRGMFLSGRPWRMLVFGVFFMVSLYGGFRSLLLMAAMVFAIQFFLERLHKTSLLAIFLVLGVTFTAVSIPFATHLPYAMQRALSVFYVPVSPDVAIDTQNSNEWRLRMWQQVLPQVSEYWLVGKGYGLNVRDTILVHDMLASGRALERSSVAQTVQDYHNGPLSVMIPLGIFGALTLLWFWYGGFRLLVANYRYGDPALHTVNCLLLALFLAKLVHFLLIFGSLYQDFCQFAGLLGLSAAFNGGMARKASALAPAIAPTTSEPTGVLPQPNPAFQSAR